MAHMRYLTTSLAKLSLELQAASWVENSPPFGSVALSAEKRRLRVWLPRRNSAQQVDTC